MVSNEVIFVSVMFLKDYVEERHRHRYEVNVDYVKAMEEKGLRFVGHDTDNVRMEVSCLSAFLPLSVHNTVQHH